MLREYRHVYLYLYVSEPQQVRRFWYVLEYYMRGYRSLLKLTELIRRNTEDPAVLSGLDNLQKTLKGTNDSNDGDNLKFTKVFMEITMFTQQQKLFLFSRKTQLKPCITWKEEPRTTKADHYAVVSEKVGTLKDFRTESG